MLRRRLDGVMVRLVGLDDDPAAQQAAPGPPSHLGQHLEGAFTGTVIR
ncbi:MAG: hypothetical protein H6651_03335 [Ardenticatenales bacterium]|nr:hypothetical protein [Ardenticatenales bacterium]